MLLVTVILSLLCSCQKEEEKIDNIKVDDSVHQTIYLYSFKDANMEGLERGFYENTKISPTPFGYVFSTRKLSSGDSVQVWNGIGYHWETPSYSGQAYTVGTDAVVDKVIKTYRVSIEEKTDTYKVTYYEMPANKTFSTQEEIEDLTSQKIEVVKERVTIQYET